MSRAVIVIGLQYGDEGKGALVDFITKQIEAKLVVRFNGGAQAAHHVIAPNGKVHCFSQFGAGTFAGAKTYLSQMMLINPHFIDREAVHLNELGITDPYELLSVDTAAFVTTPFHIAANRLKELDREGNRHGSCGMGIGETIEDIDRGDALQVRDLQHPGRTKEKLQAIAKRIAFELEREGVDPTGDEEAAREWDIFDNADEVIRHALLTYKGFCARTRIYPTGWLHDERGNIVFEGAQGVLLDQDYGFHPHTTWSKTTTHQAEALLLGATHVREVERVGVLRSFTVRHGPGPMPTEASSWQELVKNDHNVVGKWQGPFRAGGLDLAALRYALDVQQANTDPLKGHGLGIPLTCLAVTHLDLMPATAPKPVCTAYLPHFNEDQELPLRLFTTEGQIVYAHRSLEQQANLTHHLMNHVAPWYEDFHAKGDDFAKLLGTMLKVPVRYISRGPERKDKRVVTP